MLRLTHMFLLNSSLSPLRVSEILYFPHTSIQDALWGQRHVRIWRHLQPFFRYLQKLWQEGSANEELQEHTCHRCDWGLYCAVHRLHLMFEHSLPILLLVKIQILQLLMHFKEISFKIFRVTHYPRIILTSYFLNIHPSAEKRKEKKKTTTL